MQYNTYYRKEVWGKFKDEPQKSDLVNLLLRRHYDFYQPGTLVEEFGPTDESIVGNKELAKILKPDDPECPRHHVRMSVCQKQH